MVSSAILFFNAHEGNLFLYIAFRYSGGELLTLVFPIRAPDERGPPYAVSLALLRELLEPAGFECLELDMLPSELCHEGRDGSSGSGSGVGRWRRKA